MHEEVLVLVEFDAEYPDLVDLELELVHLLPLLDQRWLPQRWLLLLFPYPPGLGPERLQGLVTALVAESIRLLGDGLVRVGFQRVVQALVQPDLVIDGWGSGQHVFGLRSQSFLVHFATKSWWATAVIINFQAILKTLYSFQYFYSQLPLFRHIKVTKSLLLLAFRMNLLDIIIKTVLILHVHLTIVKLRVEDSEHIVLSEYLNIGLPEFCENFLSPLRCVGLPDQRDQLKIVALHHGIFKIKGMLIRYYFLLGSNDFFFSPFVLHLCHIWLH